MHQNLATPTTIDKIKWESDGLIDGYYVVGVIVILYLGFGVITNIVSNKDNSYYVQTMTFHNAHAWDSSIVFHDFEK